MVLTVGLLTSNLHAFSRALLECCFHLHSQIHVVKCSLFVKIRIVGICFDSMVSYHPLAQCFVSNRGLIHVYSWT